MGTGGSGTAPAIPVSTNPNIPATGPMPGMPRTGDPVAPLALAGLLLVGLACIGAGACLRRRDLPVR
jgi:hypothetical protein